MEWAQEVNATLLEFEGQVTIHEIENMTRKQLYYLRKARQEFKKHQREMQEAAEAKMRDEQMRQSKMDQSGMRRPTPPRPATHRPKSGRRK